MSKKITFVRHARTFGNIYNPNKGAMFFGRRSDYGIISPEFEEIEALKEQVKDCKTVFCSPAKRCRETVELIKSQDSKVILDENLHELNYGDIDGVFLEDAKKRYPSLFEEWSQGKDPKFPNGENTEDIFNRYNNFMKDIQKNSQENILVCTHSFFLRVLFGDYFEIPMKDWFKVYIPYFEIFEFELNQENKLVYNGTEEQKSRILKEFEQEKQTNNIQTYLVMLTPEKKTYNKIVQAKEYIFHKFGNQKYLEDEPHSTLYLSLTPSLEEVQEIMGKIVKNSFKIKTKVQNEFQEFPNDTIAGGGTSIGVKFDQESTQEIQYLQKEIVESLNHLRQNKVHKRFKNQNLSRNLMESLKDYGYPFVNGKDNEPILIPHINFCTFKDEKNAEEFKKEKPIEEFSGPMIFDRLSLYKLNEDDSIELVKHFELQ